MRRLSAVLVAALTTAALVVTVAPVAPAQAAGQEWVKKAQRRLNDLGCNAGPADGGVGKWTRSAVIRFQSRHGMKQTGKLDAKVRKRIHRNDAERCDRRPVPARSGQGRRIVISQGQNWVWLIGPQGKVVAQTGMVDLPSQLRKGSHRTGSYCGRAARIKRNSNYGGNLWLPNFVRFAPCGIGFHRIPLYKSNGRQIHPDWYLGTNFSQSHGCIRLSGPMSQKVWNFTKSPTNVRVL